MVGLIRGKGNVAVVIAFATALLAACAQQPTTPPAAAAAPTPAAPATPPPAAAPEPVREDKPLAQKLALEAVDQLQQGDEAAARATLERAQPLDPANELVRKLLDQIRADPQKELGTTFFRYTVQPSDTLSLLAQRFLGDRFRFYVLARYNDIANPSRLQAGQVIKIPGVAPPPSPPAAARPPAPVIEAPAAKPPAPEPEVRTSSEAERLYRQGQAMKASGNLDGAYAAFNDAARREPSNAEYAKQADATRRELVRRYDREATQAFQRQNLDLAIEKWDRVLELDPSNQKAKLERARAEDLRRRLQDKFGGRK